MKKTSRIEEQMGSAKLKVFQVKQLHLLYGQWSHKVKTTTVDFKILNFK